MALAALLVRAHVRARMAYRLDFLIGVLHAVGFQLTGLAFVWTVLQRFPDLGGWRVGEVAFLYALRLLSHSLYAPLLGNVTALSDLVRSGELDRLLLRPVHPLLLLVTRRLEVSAAGDLLLAGAVFWAAQDALGVAWTPSRLGYLALAVAGGALLEAGVHLLLSSLAVWLVDAEALNRWARQLFGTFGAYPLTVYPRLLQAGFTFLLPLAFVAYFPATLLLDRRDSGVVGVQPLFGYAAPAVGGLVFAAAVAGFGLALRHYRSTGH